MRLYVFDVDGTLVGRDLELKEDVINLLNRVLDNGDVVAIASGRPYSGILQYFNLLHDGKKYCICANGAEVRDINGNVLFQDTLKLKDYYEFIKKHENIYNHDHTNIYVYTSDGLGYFKYDKFIKSESECNSGFPLIDLNKVNYEDNYPILKFMIATTKEFSIEIDNFITANEKDSYKVVRSSPIFIEFINKNADKSEGVAFLEKYLSLDKNDIYTFGDSGNDIEMIKNFNGIAMGNAINECKSNAKFITKSVDDHGIVYAFENYIKNY